MLGSAGSYSRGGSVGGSELFGGLLTAAIVVFLFVLAIGFAAQATVGLALGRLLLRTDGRSFGSTLGALLLPARPARRQVAEPVDSASPSSP